MATVAPIYPNKNIAFLKILNPLLSTTIKPLSLAAKDKEHFSIIWYVLGSERASLFNFLLFVEENLLVDGNSFFVEDHFLQVHDGVVLQVHF